MANQATVFFIYLAREAGEVDQCSAGVACARGISGQGISDLVSATGFRQTPEADTIFPSRIASWSPTGASWFNARKLLLLLWLFMEAPNTSGH
jgi:hypothetical protein